MEKKKRSGIARLLEIAGQRRGLVTLSCALSAVSAALMLVPFLNVYFILGELLQHGLSPPRTPASSSVRGPSPSGPWRWGSSCGTPP